MKKILFGVSLIEMMMVVAMISVLAALSFPIYSGYVIKTKRLEAAGLLMKLSVAMEAYQIENNTYQGATLEALHFSVKQDSAYRFVIQNFEHDYLLLAEPVGWQAQQDIECGGLTLNSAGEKALTGTGKLDDCW